MLLLLLLLLFNLCNKTAAFGDRTNAYSYQIDFRFMPSRQTNDSYSETNERQQFQRAQIYLAYLYAVRVGQ